VATGATAVDGGGARAAAWVAQRALCAGAQAGLEALALAALQLAGASGVRLQLARGHGLCQAGPLPPAARETAGVQWLAAGALRLALRTPGLSPAQREQLEPLLRLAPALLAAREREAAARAHAAACAARSASRQSAARGWRRAARAPRTICARPCW
jgi:two-component system, OmpR family, sensor kinase